MFAQFDESIDAFSFPFTVAFARLLAEDLHHGLVQPDWWHHKTFLGWVFAQNVAEVNVENVAVFSDQEVF